MERLAIDTVAGNLPSLDEEQLHALAKRLESLPAVATAVDSIRAEKALYEKWIVRILSEPDGKKKLLALYSGTESYEGVVKAIREHSVEELLAALKEAARLYDRIAEAAVKSPAEVKQDEKQFVADSGVEGLAREMAVGLFPSYGGARLAEAEHQTRLALIKAAIAVQLNGPEVLKNDAHRDPFGSGPFSYATTANGFELRSSFTDREDQPVSLTVGRP
jgi:hypothetical protein